MPVIRCRVIFFAILNIYVVIFLPVRSFAYIKTPIDSVDYVNINENYKLDSGEYWNDTVVKNSISNEIINEDPATAFDGVYTECVLFLSYSCIQKKTLLYLKKMNELNEVSFIGDYITFVKIKTRKDDYPNYETGNTSLEASSSNLGSSIDEAIETFFKDHAVRLRFGRRTEVLTPRTIDEFVGRKKRKGGGGGGGGDDGDGGKKKLMMMAMMCMKMKMMLMMPAMMGMMGMMTFKGMMFSMMSFFMTKMMILMKLLQGKGGMGGGHGGGGDGGWGGGGGGPWMPAGGDGSGGGGYNAAGEWQSRSIPVFNHVKRITEPHSKDLNQHDKVSYVTPSSYLNILNDKPIFYLSKKYKETEPDSKEDENLQSEQNVKSRKKRGLIEALSYIGNYWTNRLLNLNPYNSRFGFMNYSKNRNPYSANWVPPYNPYYKYYLYRMKKHPKFINTNQIKVTTESNEKYIGESQDNVDSKLIRRGRSTKSIYGRTLKKKKIQEMSDTVVEDPWK